MSNFKGTPFHDYTNNIKQWGTKDVAFAREFRSVSEQPTGITVQLEDPFFPSGAGEVPEFLRMGQINWVLRVPGMFIVHTYEFRAACDVWDERSKNPYEPKDKDGLEWVLEKFNKNLIADGRGEFDYRARGKARLEEYRAGGRYLRAFANVAPEWESMIDGYIGTHEAVVNIEPGVPLNRWVMEDVYADFNRLTCWLENYEALRKMARIDPGGV